MTTIKEENFEKLLDDLIDCQIEDNKIKKSEDNQNEF